nr:MAG TPA: hypothetical protein [Caudoviricetes sp.]
MPRSHPRNQVLSLRIRRATRCGYFSLMVTIIKRIITMRAITSLMTSPPWGFDQGRLPYRGFILA